MAKEDSLDRLFQATAGALGALTNTIYLAKTGEVAEDPAEGRAIRLPQCPACRPVRQCGINRPFGLFGL